MNNLKKIKFIKKKSISIIFIFVFPTYEEIKIEKKNQQPVIKTKQETKIQFLVIL